MIKISLTTSDINRQIDLLKNFPQIASRNYRPALTRVTKALYGEVLPNIPSKTGKARSDFGSKVSGRTITSLKGQVGWFDKGDVWYPNILEYGARPHSLVSGSTTRSRKDARLFQEAMESGSVGAAHVFIDGQWRTMRVHPGFSGMGFMAAGYSALKPIIDFELQQANEAVVRELAA